MECGEPSLHGVLYCRAVEEEWFPPLRNPSPYMIIMLTRPFATNVALTICTLMIQDSSLHLSMMFPDFMQNYLEKFLTLFFLGNTCTPF